MHEPEDETEPFDENQLLELARREGLAEPIDEAAEGEPSIGLAKLSEIPEQDQQQIMASMETILFMSDRPVSLPKLRALINADIPLPAYRALMGKLREDFARECRGVEIAELSLGLQLRTKPHMAPVLRRMVKTQPLKLTAASMEVLAIVAYKQPVTKDELDQIRGVDCGYVLRALMEKRLIRISGRSDLPGKPMLYGTTHEFLELFNLKEARDLPPLHEVESMVAASEVGLEEKTSHALEEFSKVMESSDTILFDDSGIDQELEGLREEIARVPTSTPYIEEQKAKEKLAANPDSQGASAPQAPAPPETPSPELQAEAAAAQWERHRAIIAEAVASANSEAAAETKPEQRVQPEEAQPAEPSPAEPS